MNYDLGVRPEKLRFRNRKHALRNDMTNLYDHLERRRSGQPGRALRRTIIYLGNLFYFSKFPRVFHRLGIGIRLFKNAPTAESITLHIPKSKSPTQEPDAHQGFLPKSAFGLCLAWPLCVAANNFDLVSLD